MWLITRCFITSTVLSSVLAFTGCAGHAFGTPSTGSEFSAAVSLNTSYSFKVQNDTDSEVTLKTFEEECMIRTLGGKIAPNKTQDVEVETKTGQGCESHKQSYFTTKFSKMSRGDYADYRFVKRTLSPWKLEHRDHGPTAKFSVELTNEFTFTRVKIYKHG
jgi:hypothetical protein